MRITHLDPRDAPFAKSMLAEPNVQDALKVWMLAAKAPAWMSWTDVEDALETAGLDLHELTIRFPSTSVA